MSKSRSKLQPARATDRFLDLNTYNGLIDFCRDHGVPIGQGGYSDQFGNILKPLTIKQRELWWPCVSDDDADPFSILEVYEAQPAGQGFYFKVRKATPDAALYCGNENYLLLATGTGSDNKGWIKLITPFEPVTVRSVGGSIELNTSLQVTDGDFTVEVASGSTDLLSLTQPEDTTGKVGVISKSQGTARDSFLAVLTDKDYTADRYTEYSWIEVTASNTSPDTPVTYHKTDRFGCPGHNPAYHVANHDYPVQVHLFGLGEDDYCQISTDEGMIDGWSVVRMWKGNGDFYLFGDHPRVDLYHRTGDAGMVGEVCIELIWNQETLTFQFGRTVEMISP